MRTGYPLSLRFRLVGPALAAGSIVFGLAAGLGCGPSVSGSADADVTAPDATATIDATVDPADARIRADARDNDFSRVYAHSGDVLYRIDTTDLEAVVVGTFDNQGDQGISDIAIDQDDRMVGITRERVYEIDETTGQTSGEVELTGINDLSSLSFVPTDIDANRSDEILVAADRDGVVYQIGATGVATEVGSYGTTPGGDPIGSSGDIVAIRHVGVFATVDVDGPGNDYLARIDSTDGWKATLIGTGTGFDKIFGLGYWRGKLYGFVDTGPQNVTGAFIEIDLVTGAGTLIEDGAIRWFGAGVATNAPIVD